MIVKLPVFVIVTDCVRTLATNAAVVIGAPVKLPVEVRTAVLVKAAMLLFASSAVMSMLNGVPAVCCAILPRPPPRRGEGVTAPLMTVNAALVPVADGLVPAVIVKLLVFVIVTTAWSCWH